MSANKNKRIEPRNIEDLYRAIENADFVVRRRYRSDLEKYPVCDLPQWLDQIIPEDYPEVQHEDGVPIYHIGDNVQFFKVEKLVFDEAENTTDKLTTVYHTMSSFPDTSVIMILQCDGIKADIYLGVAERVSGDGTINSNNRGNKLATLRTAFEANFPGSMISEMENNVPLQKKRIIESLLQDVQAVSCVTGVASLRNKEVRDNKEFVQGLEKLIDAMRGQVFSAIFIADCKGIVEVEDICASYEDIYSKLSPFAQSQQTIGTSTGITDTESFIEGVTDTTNESVSDTMSHSHTLGTSKSNTVGVTVDTGKLLGKIPVVGKLLGAAFDGVSANYSHTSTKNKSDTDTKAKTQTKGTAKSLSKQNSVAKSIATSTNDGLQISFQNRAVKTLMDRIDEQINHLRDCEAYGVFDFSCYFLAEESTVSASAASIYDALMRGDESGSEVASVNTWTDESASKILGYLKRFYHPLIAVPNVAKPIKGEPEMCEILPVSPSTIISGKEIALHMGMPRKSVLGLPVISCVAFGRNVVSKDEDYAGNIELGYIYHMQKVEDTVPVKLTSKDLTMHTFVTGSTGSGKSNTVYQMIDQVTKVGAKFLVVEPAKGEYKNVFGRAPGLDVSVYGTNPNISKLLRINPFSFPEKIHIYEHMDQLIEIFNVCWPMYAAMPAVLKDAIERAYIEAGWNLKTSQNQHGRRLYPTFGDVLRQIDVVMEESQYSSDSKGDYKGALSTRLKSLTNGINGMIFTSDELSAEKLFEENVIVDLSRVGSTETKALIMGLLVMKLQEHRVASEQMNADLKHVTVLEEAHNLLKRTSTEQTAEGSNLVGKSVEMITNAIAEMRTYGEGFIIVDQAPGLLDMAAVRNTNTKIILRLPEYSDRELVGKACGLNEDQIEELARFEKGVAAVYQNDWIEAVLCKVVHYTSNETPFSEKTTVIDQTSLVKSTIFDAIIRNKLHEKIEWLDRMILSTDLPAQLKRSILEYRSKNPRDFAAISKIAYDLFEAEKVFTKLPKETSKISEHLKNALEPSVQALREVEVQRVALMLIEEQIRRHPEQQEQLRTLCGRNARL